MQPARALRINIYTNAGLFSFDVLNISFILIIFLFLLVWLNDWKDILGYFYHFIFLTELVLRYLLENIKNGNICWKCDNFDGWLPDFNCYNFYAKKTWKKSIPLNYVSEFMGYQV